MPRSIWSAELGRLEYGTAYALQRHLAAERDIGTLPDLLLFVEHPPVITLGRRGSLDDIFAPPTELARLGITVYETNRGGLVTYHGPGQIVCYPIVRLRELAGDAPTYVRGLEEVIIRALADVGIDAGRDLANRGVFAQGAKIAAIGVAVTHGVTMHGFAVNVRPNLTHFALINPCGLVGRGVTSVEQLLGRTVELADVTRLLRSHFGSVFGREISQAPSEFLRAVHRWRASLPDLATITPRVTA